MKLDRSRFLIVHGADPVAWAKRWGIVPYVGTCSECGAQTETTIPFATSELRGLMSPPCTCGNVATPYCVLGAKVDLLKQRLRSQPRRK
jgi:hypothetical protein